MKRLLPLLLSAFALTNGAHGSDEASGTQKSPQSGRLENVTGEEIEKAREEALERKARTRGQKEELKLKKRASRVDTVVVKGTVLQGRITELTSKYVAFSMVYGTGTIRIDYQNIDQLTTEHEYHIFYAGKETTGRVIGIKDHAFLVVKHGNFKELVKIDNIDRFILSVNENDTIENRLRNRFPYTRGSLDLGIETETGVKTKRKITLDFNMVRKKQNHRQILDLHYAYETTTTDTEEGAFKSLDKKELYIWGEQNYLLDRRRFLFGQLGYDFDQPRGIEYRLYPSVGFGYRFLLETDAWIQVKGGGGYVYESFYPYDPPEGASLVKKNDYGALFFGVSAKDHLKNLWLVKEAILTADIFYMPSLQDPRADWLSRMKFVVEVPVSTMLSLKWVYRIVNDDNPVPSVGDNKTTTDIFLSLQY